jgi:hypothetical protein
MARLDIELRSPLRHSHFDFRDLGCGLALVCLGRLWFSRHPNLVDQFNRRGGDRLPRLLVLVFSGSLHETLSRLTTGTSALSFLSGATIESLKAEPCLQSRAQASSRHSATQAGRLCYFSLGLSFTHVTEPMVS